MDCPLPALPYRLSQTYLQDLAWHSTAPTYLDSLISLKPQSCYSPRRSCDTLLLKQPSFKSKVTRGDRSFTCAAPKLWNALPFEVRDSKSLDIFKSKLKTHLFRLAFLL